MIEKNEFYKFQIKSNDTISSVLKILEKNRMGLSIFLKKQKLIGILTDGDIRRLLLKGVGLNEKVDKFLNKKYYFANQSKQIDEYDLITKKNDINQLPIIDKKKNLVGIYLRVNPHKKFNLNPVVIIAGGLGKRMGSLTKKTPKPMLNIKGKPIIENEILSLRKNGFRNFYISVNYLSKKIIDYFKNGKNWDLKISYLKEKKKLGTAGPLSLLERKKIKNDLIVINGDLITDINYKDLVLFHKKKKFDVTLCVRNHIQKIDYGIIDIEKKGNLMINEKPTFNYFINTGVYVFAPKVLKHLKKNNRLDMNEFINILYKKKFKIGFYMLYENFMDIGNKIQYEKISKNNV